MNMFIKKHVKKVFIFQNKLTDSVVQASEA